MAAVGDVADVDGAAVCGFGAVGCWRAWIATAAEAIINIVVPRITRDLNFTVVPPNAESELIVVTGGSQTRPYVLDSYDGSVRRFTPRTHV